MRPAEVLEPELEKAKEETKGLAVDLDDVLIYALYPVTGKKFLKWKYGKEEPPAEVKPRSLEQALKEQELLKKAKAGLLVEKEAKRPAPAKGEALRTFNVFVDEDYFEVGVDEVGGSPVLSYIQQMPAMPAAPMMMPAAAAAPVASTGAGGPGRRGGARRGAGSGRGRRDALEGPDAGHDRQVPEERRRCGDRGGNRGGARGHENGKRPAGAGRRYHQGRQLCERRFGAEERRAGGHRLNFLRRRLFFESSLQYENKVDSFGLRRIIFMYRGGFKGHDCSTRGVLAV